MMNLNQIKIDAEFQGKIPPLTFEELNQLETNILREGRIINPIILWNGTIVDGHNRFTIAKSILRFRSVPTKKIFQIGRKQSFGFARIN